MLSAGLKRYKSSKGPAAGGEGRAHVRIHAWGRGRGQGRSGQMGQAGGRTCGAAAHGGAGMCSNQPVNMATVGKALDEIHT
jgi:hypothetical protein